MHDTCLKYVIYTIKNVELIDNRFNILAVSVIINECII